MELSAWVALVMVMPSFGVSPGSHALMSASSYCEMMVYSLAGSIISTLINVCAHHPCRTLRECLHKPRHIHQSLRGQYGDNTRHGRKRHSEKQHQLRRPDNAEPWRWLHAHRIQPQLSPLYKKLMAISGRSPLEFMRIIRLRHGLTLIRQGGLTVSEVAYKVGMSPKQFAKFYKEEYGSLPSKYV